MSKAKSISNAPGWFFQVNDQNRPLVFGSLINQVCEGDSNATSYTYQNVTITGQCLKKGVSTTPSLYNNSNNSNVCALSNAPNEQIKGIWFATSVGCPDDCPDNPGTCTTFGELFGSDQ